MYNIRNFLYGRRKSMKKTNLLGALALASCVMLTGCKNKPEELPKEIEVIISGLPEVAIVGTEYDLDQYVTVKNSSESYTIEIASESASKATVTGHKFKALDEGEIKFTVKLGGKSAEGSVLAHSQVRETLIGLQKGFGHKYTVFDLGQEDTLLHDDGYLQTQHWDVDKTYQVYLAGGFLKFPNHDGVYQYTEIIADIEDDEPVYEVEIDEGIYSNALMEYYNSDVETDFSDLVNLKREFDSSVVKEGEPALEVLTLKGKAAREFAENSFFLPNGTYTFYTDDTYTETYDAPITKLEFLVDDIGTEEAPIIVTDVLAFAEVYPDDDTSETPTKKEMCVNEYYMTSDARYVGDPLVQAVLADPEKIPAGGNYAKLLGIDSFFGEDLSCGDPAVATYQYGWYVNATATAPGHFFDTTSEEYAEFFEEEVEETIFEDAPNGSSMRIFSENIIVNVSGGALNDGLFQVVDDSGETPVTTVYEFDRSSAGYQVYETSKFADITKDGALSLTSLGSAWASDSLAYVGAQPVGGTEESPIVGYMFSLNPYAGYPVLDALLASEPGLASLVSIMDQYKERFDIRGMFQSSIMFVPAWGYFQASFSLSWDEAGLYSYQVNFSASFDDTYDGNVQSLYAGLQTLIPSEE